MKRCSSCLETRPIEDFMAWLGGFHGGTNRPKSEVKTCQSCRDRKASDNRAYSQRVSQTSGPLPQPGTQSYALSCLWCGDLTWLRQAPARARLLIQANQTPRCPRCHAPRVLEAEDAAGPGRAHLAHLRTDGWPRLEDVS